MGTPPQPAPSAEPTQPSSAPEMGATTPDPSAAAPDTGQPPETPSTPEQQPSAPGDVEAELGRVRQALHKANKDAERLRLQVKEHEDAQKTNEQKLADDLAAARSSSEANERQLLQLQAAMATAPPGFDPQQLADWASRLRGSTLEELTADAEALFASITPPAPAGNGQTSQPVESLRPGALPTTPQLNLPEQIAAAEAAGDLAKARDLKAQLFFEQQKKLSQ